MRLILQVCYALRLLFLLTGRLLRPRLVFLCAECGLRENDPGASEMGLE